MRERVMVPLEDILKEEAFEEGFVKKIDDGIYQVIYLGVTLDVIFYMYVKFDYWHVIVEDKKVYVAGYAVPDNLKLPFIADSSRKCYVVHDSKIRSFLIELKQKGYKIYGEELVEM